MSEIERRLLDFLLNGGASSSPARVSAQSQPLPDNPVTPMEETGIEKAMRYGSIPARLATKMADSALHSAWSGLTYPGEVFAGRAPPDDIGRVLDTAGLLTFGNLGGAKGFQGFENVASRNPYLYDPPVKPPRSFLADYPMGAVADDTGKLVHDIDGRQLSARHVVGRRSLSGPDVALPPEALDEIATARTGASIRSSAPGSPDIGQDMGRAVFRSGGSPDYVAVSKSLTEPARSRVAAHEIGHVIDQTAGEIPTAGLSDELRGIYNALNNPQGHGKPFGPEQSRYKGEAVQRELMSEAIRAYMADPNYIKTVAPKTAARIRQYVNDNSQLRDIIQFNAGGVPVGLSGYQQPEPLTEERFGALYRAGLGT